MRAPCSVPLHNTTTSGWFIFLYVQLCDKACQHLCACLQATFTPQWDPSPSKAFTPQQAFMSLKSRESGSLVLVAAKAGKEGSYTISVSPDTISHQIGTQVAPLENALCNFVLKCW